MNTPDLPPPMCPVCQAPQLQLAWEDPDGEIYPCHQCGATILRRPRNAQSASEPKQRRADDS